MKTVNRLFLLMILCSAIATSIGCTNTSQGFHEDWRSNMQKMANSTNN